MSFLFPLYLMGGLAVVGPIVLHMIRRQTKTHVEFSSLMFLRASPPVIQKRSKLENLLLLLLRCAVLLLLALAFARPFMKGAMGEEGAGVGQRVVVLLDVSASMRRDGMWEDAVESLDEVVGELEVGDGLAVIAFDGERKLVVGFEEWAAVGVGERAGLLAGRVKAMEPGWGGTDLGGALVAGAEMLEEAEAGDASGGVDGEGGDTAVGVMYEKRMVLIGDVASGSNLSSLNTYAWPEGVAVEVRRVESEKVTNGSLQLVVGAGAEEEDEGAAKVTDGVRVRVTNAGNSEGESFELKWAGDESDGGGRSVYVAAGQSRVVTAPKRALGGGGGVLELTGDEHGFDNRVYVSESTARAVRILYLGDDVKANPRQPLYYVKRAFGETVRRVPEVVAKSVGGELLEMDVEGAHLVVVTGVLDDAAVAMLRKHLEAGRTVLVAMGSTEMGATVAGLAGVERLDVVEAKVRDYAMIESVDLKAPLLGAFGGGRFGDFSGIHIWKHRTVNFDGIDGAQVLARYDDGGAAWVEVSVGKGSLVVMTAGWHPVDSQFALSSKFVIWMYSVLERSGEVVAGATQYFVGDAAPIQRMQVRMPSGGDSVAAVRKPSGGVVVLGVDVEVFEETNEPGEYVVEVDGLTRKFAVNLGAGEGKTGALDLGRLEQLGVELAEGEVEEVAEGEEEAEVAERELARSESEGRQKGWRWVVLGALGLLMVETWLAGKLVGAGGGEDAGDRQAESQEGDVS